MTSWEQKLAKIAQTMQGGVNPGGLDLGSIGASFTANPLLGQPAAIAAPSTGGLMGSTSTQGVDPQTAAMQQMPGFNYVPPPTGPAPDPAAAAGAGASIPWTRDDKLAFLRGRQTPANAMAYTQALGQGAYDYNRQGRGGGGYTTSGRGGSGSSSSARGGGFRGF
jgi:hypothetical protein